MPDFTQDMLKGLKQMQSSANKMLNEMITPEVLGAMNKDQLELLEETRNATQAKHGEDLPKKAEKLTEILRKNAYNFKF